MAPIPPPPADLAERFQAMKRQEDAYKVLDYLNPANCAESAGLRGQTSNKNMPAKTAAKLHLTECPPAIARTSRQNNNCSSAGVSEEWRTKICEWSCKSSPLNFSSIYYYLSDRCRLYYEFSTHKSHHSPSATTSSFFFRPNY